MQGLTEGSGGERESNRRGCTPAGAKGAWVPRRTAAVS
jgi:hypothetical protein